MAVWLLAIISLVSLSTFGLWFFKELKGQNKPTEEHTEQMAAIALFGRNQDGQPPLITPIEQVQLGQNPRLSQEQEEQGEG